MGHRLLLIEDQLELREQLADLLQGHDFVIDTCADGIEGLYVAQKFQYDVAVIDLGLPRLSGLDIIRKIREDGRDYPILILTARADWKDKVEGLAAGADDYLVKPFHVQELLARLEAMLRHIKVFWHAAFAANAILESQAPQTPIQGIVPGMVDAGERW